MGAVSLSPYMKTMHKTADDFTSEQLLLIRRQLAGRMKMTLIAKLNSTSVRTIRAIARANGHYSC